MWSRITENAIRKITGEYEGQKNNNLKYLISEFELVEYKFLSEWLWGLTYPLLDHFIMFKDCMGKEYVVSNTYSSEEDIISEMENHKDLSYAILRNKSYYRPYGTNLVVFWQN